MMNVVALTSSTTSTVKQIPKPTIDDPNDSNQVLVRVHYSALDTFLHEIANGTFGASLAHNLKASPLIPGNHFAGKVEQVGSKVSSTIGVGDAVFGHLQYTSSVSQGSCSEYLVIPDTELAKLPTNSSSIPLDIAAAATTEGLTAYQALQKGGMSIKEEGGSCSSILIIGAGGGVGSLAVSMARLLQENVVVDAVCSAKDVAAVKALGADEVIDRKTTPVEELQTLNKYDCIFDASGLYSFTKVQRLLKPGGRLVSTQPSIPGMLFGTWLFPLLFQKKSYQFVLVESKREDLQQLAEWLDAKKVPVAIDSTYKAVDFDQAWQRQNSKDKKGRIVIQVKGGW